jgi:RNA polymerase sigma-70 factor, Bacteroides expansion family 1
MQYKIHNGSVLNTDEQLLGKMADGDRQAFTFLYRRYWEALFITAAKTLRGKEEAADVVQDVFLSLWNRRKELNIQGSVAAYLHTSVRYKCINYIERNITRRDYLLLLTEVQINNFPTNPESKLIWKEMQESIGKAVSSMPPKMQEVYKLSRLEHLSHKEIAEYMSISVETVKKHIHHALNVIRTDMPSNIYNSAAIIIFFCVC